MDLPTFPILDDLQSLHACAGLPILSNCQVGPARVNEGSSITNIWSHILDVAMVIYHIPQICRNTIFVLISAHIFKWPKAVLVDHSLAKGA